MMAGIDAFWTWYHQPERFDTTSWWLLNGAFGLLFLRVFYMATLGDSLKYWKSARSKRRMLVFGTLVLLLQLGLGFTLLRFYELEDPRQADARFEAMRSSDRESTFEPAFLVFVVGPCLTAFAVVKGARAPVESDLPHWDRRLKGGQFDEDQSEY